MTKIRRGPLGLLAVVALVFAGCVASPGAAPGTPSQVAPSAAIVATPTSAPSAVTPTQVPVPSPSVVPMTAAEFWASLFTGDSDFATYPSLTAIVSDTDAILVGSFTGLERGPTYTDEYGNVLFTGALTVHVERLLHGSVNTKKPGMVTVLVILGLARPEDAPYTYEDRLASLKAGMPAERGLFFLSNMAAWVAKFGGDPKRPEADPFMYEVMSSQGYVRDVKGLAEPPIRGTSAWPETLRGRPFDDVVAQIAAIEPVP